MKPAEVVKFFQLVNSFGTKWSLIARELPGTSDNSLKNYFHNCLRRGIRNINDFIVKNDGEKKSKKIKLELVDKVLAAQD